MKLSNIWSKIGRQPLRITQNTDAVVFVGEDQYYITGMRFENGNPVGFDAVEIDCVTCQNNEEVPPPHTCDVCASSDQLPYCMWGYKKN